MGRLSATFKAPVALGDTTQNYIGRSQFNDPALNGSVDDFRIYDRALTPAEIGRLAGPTIVAIGVSSIAGNTSASEAAA